MPARSFDVLVIASSAGGITALAQLLAGLPADFPVPVLVVQHLAPRHRRLLPAVLGRCSLMKVKLAEDLEIAAPGVVHLAPPDRHLLLGAGGVLTLSTSDRVHYLRPSADPLFESVATAYGPRALACVLTGMGRDGSAGVMAIKACGGTVIAQDPATAEFASMPLAAVATGAVDVVVALTEMVEVISELVGGWRAK